MIKYIVFDFDGTLADTFEIIRKIAKKEFENISDSDIELVRERGIKYVLKRKKISYLQLPKMVLRATSLLKKEKELKLFEGITDLIKNLSKKYRLGIVSSNSEDNIIRTLEKYKIEKFFEFIYSDSSLFGKHLVLKRMCKKYNIHTSDIIYVGDEDRDIIAAKKVMIKNIAVTWGFNSRNRLKKVKPDFIVDLPNEIEGLMK